MLLSHFHCTLCKQIELSTIVSTGATEKGQRLSASPALDIDIAPTAHRGNNGWPLQADERTICSGLRQPVTTRASDGATSLLARCHPSTPSNPFGRVGGRLSTMLFS